MLIRKKEIGSFQFKFHIFSGNTFGPGYDYSSIKGVDDVIRPSQTFSTQFT